MGSMHTQKHTKKSHSPVPTNNNGKTCLKTEKEGGSGISENRNGKTYVADMDSNEEEPVVPNSEAYTLGCPTPVCAATAGVGKNAVHELW